ncbi:MAG: radical SAM protein [Candidatus Fermentibacteraceae bacterium]|nr:radical SAM protein [Candidatus Fermentibacteraceae bacterium]
MSSTIPDPSVLYINPAGGCNLHCKHCWVNEGSTDEENLTLSQWKKLLIQAKSLGTRYVKLTGGEPFLYNDVVSLYRFIAGIFPEVVIETNGTLQPDGIWEAFTEAKPYHVSVSIDSADQSVHDEFRGGIGAWKKTVNFAEKLVSSGINSQIIMSVADTARQPVLDMIDLTRSIGVSTLKINFISPSGRGKSNSFFDNISIQDTLDFFHWFDTATPRWVLPSVPPALLPVNRLSSLGYCPVRNLMGVLPDGTFSLCGVAFYRDDMSWGRFPENSVEDAWKNSTVYRMIRSSLPDKLEGVCSRCIHKNSCIGRCVVNNLETGGSITSPDILCQRAWEAGLFPETRLL